MDEATVGGAVHAWKGMEMVEGADLTAGRSVFFLVLLLV